MKFLAWLSFVWYLFFFLVTTLFILVDIFAPGWPADMDPHRLAHLPWGSMLLLMAVAGGGMTGAVLLVARRATAKRLLWGALGLQVVYYVIYQAQPTGTAAGAVLASCVISLAACLFATFKAGV